MNEGLLARARDLFRTLDDGRSSARLIGGLGVLLSVREPDVVRDEDIDVMQPLVASLLRVTRVTDDVDLVIVAAADLRDSLSTAGLRPSTSTSAPPDRWTGGGLTVDVIRAQPSSREPLQTATAILYEHGPGPSEIQGIPVAHPAALLLLKCLACHQRSEARDYADIALLAVDDASRTTPRILSGMETLRGAATGDLPRAVRTARARFADPEDRGPSEFAKVFSASLAFSKFERLGYEDEARRHVAVTTTELLDAAVAILEASG